MKLNKLCTLFLSLIAVLGSVLCCPISEEKDAINYAVRQESLAFLSTSTNELYNSSLKSVVTILNYKSGALNSLGSGFIYYEDDKYQYIITNNHVVDGGDSYRVMSYLGQIKKATLLGSDKYLDCALLKVETLDGAVKAKFKNDDYRLITNPIPGEEAYAIGNPGSIENYGTISKGIVAAVDRNPLSSSFEKAEYAIQIDVTLNPGNSGGPLFDMDGNVIGVNTFKVNEVSDVVYKGLNYALPIQDVLCIVESIRKTGSFSRATFGKNTYCMVNELTLYQRNYLGIPGEINEGAIVIDFSANNKLEFSKYSIIDSINNHKIVSLAEFRRRLYEVSPGDEVNLKYYEYSDEGYSSLKEINVKTILLTL